MIEEHLSAWGQPPAAPHLVAVEVRYAVRGLRRAKHLTGRRCEQDPEDLGEPATARNGRDCTELTP